MSDHRYELTVESDHDSQIIDMMVALVADSLRDRLMHSEHPGGSVAVQRIGLPSV